MADDPGLAYGERVVSWRTMWNDLYPDPEEAPHDEDLAAEMHWLRGLVMAQACETEAVLARFCGALNLLLPLNGPQVSSWQTSGGCSALPPGRKCQKRWT